MASIMGKPKDDTLMKEATKETIAQAVKKKYPLVPKQMLRKQIDRFDKKMSKKNGLGL
ncbi:MAG: hypothetical protein LBV38_00875 [Alistipes sp.]|jgi:hypothetical protein|nr:hypothetical protein [Alistipes sp.]